MNKKSLKQRKNKLHICKDLNYTTISFKLVHLSFMTQFKLQMTQIDSSRNLVKCFMIICEF